MMYTNLVRNTNNEHDSVREIALRTFSLFPQHNHEFFLVSPCHAVTVLNHTITADTVVIGFVDLVSASDHAMVYDYWRIPESSWIMDDLRLILSRNPDRKFVFLCSEMQLLEKWFGDHPNVKLMKWLHDCPIYSCPPPIEKSFSTSVHAVSLNRQMRVHRLALTSLLYGMELNRHCYISATKFLFDSEFMFVCNWIFDARHEGIKQTMIQGFDRLAENHRDCRDNAYVTTENGNAVIIDNQSNFQNNLVKIYSNSAVEIISGTSFSIPVDNIDEKFFNSVYGLNFPILLSPPGTVELYRTLGFDMFDDIVNHAYDRIDHPIDRMQAMIADNLELLTNRDWAIKCWQDHTDRLISNYRHAINGAIDKLMEYNTRSYLRTINA